MARGRAVGGAHLPDGGACLAGSRYLVFALRPQGMARGLKRGLPGRAKRRARFQLRAARAELAPLAWSRAASRMKSDAALAAPAAPTTTTIVGPPHCTSLATCPITLPTLTHGCHLPRDSRVSVCAAA